MPQEFGNEFIEATELSGDLIPNLKKEKQAIIEGSQSGLTDGTKKLIQAAQQQSPPSNSGMSSINPGLLESSSEENF